MSTARRRPGRHSRKRDRTSASDPQLPENRTVSMSRFLSASRRGRAHDLGAVRRGRFRSRPGVPARADAGPDTSSPRSTARRSPKAISLPRHRNSASSSPRSRPSSGARRSSRSWSSSALPPGRPTRRASTRTRWWRRVSHWCATACSAASICARRWSRTSPTRRSRSGSTRSWPSSSRGRSPRRHILVPTEEEAKAIIAELDKGGDFAEIAKEKSQDPGSAPNGGDLGFFAKGRW